MATVVRVKRKRTVDPVDALIISAKRRKENFENTDLSGKDELKALLKFAGTVSKNNENIAKHIRNAIRKDKLEKEYKQHGINIRTQSHETQASATKRNRYHVLSTHRAGQLDALDITENVNKDVSSRDEEKGESLEETETDERSIKRTKLLSDASDHEKIFCLYDVQDSNAKTLKQNGHNESRLPSASDIITCNTVPMRKEKVLITIPPPNSSPESVYDLCYTNNKDAESDYVYDLYYTNSSEFDWHVIEQLLTIEALEAGAELEHKGDSESDEVYEDEDDSNDESNWRNDYPDEDPYFIESNAKGARFDNDDFSEAYDALPDHLSSSCKIGSQDAEELSSEDDEAHLYFNDPVAATHLYPQTSYETFCHKVLKEAYVGESDNDSSDDESGT